MAIVTHDDICEGVPRVDGTSVTVIDVYDAYARGGMSAPEVAEEFDLPLARVHESLAYYHDHFEPMRRLEQSD